MTDPLRLVLPLAAAAALAACEREPRTIVAAPADAPRDAGAAAAQPTDAPPPAPGQPAPPAAGASQGPGLPTSAELLAQVEAMKERLASAPKSLEILQALGNLYYQEERWKDAIGWYDQAIALTEPGWREYLALPAAARDAEPSAAAEEACARTQERGFEALSKEAERRARRKDRAGAAACWRAALAPSIGVRIQRANARLLSGDERGAIEDHETVLARVPDQPDALYFLGLALAETARGDVAQLERARALWRRVAELQPGGPYARDLAIATAEVERRIAAAQSARGGR